MKLFQAYLGDAQKRVVSAAAIPWNAASDAPGEQREYELFRLIARERPAGLADDEPWGLVSWKFEHKSRVPVERFHRFCTEKLAEGYECVFINPMIGNEAMYINVWEQGSHPGMLEIATHLREQCGIATTDAYMGASSFAFCNYFVGTAALWEAYFAFVERALESLESEANSGSATGKLYRAAAAYPRDPSTSMRPFIIERLFSSFLHTNPSIRAIGYPSTRADFTEKFGAQMGRFLHALYTVKRRGIQEGNMEMLHAWDGSRRAVVEGDVRWVVSHLDDPLPYFLTEEHFRFLDRVGP